jgi:homoserine O-acetyltransferase
MHEKFGRRLQDKAEYSFRMEVDFQVESYLHYQGDNFVKRFDANSYLYITKAIDYFDLAGEGTLAEAFRRAKAKFLVISISSDWLYPSYQSREITEALASNDLDVSYCEIRSNFGHDAFLLEAGQMNYIFNGFLSCSSVGDVMEREVVTIGLGASVEDAARRMMEEEATHLPVIADDGKLEGIVTAWDVSKAVAMKYTRLREIMTPQVITIQEDEPIELAARRMKDHDISALPVLDEEGRVLGMVTSDGISRLIGICR